MNFTGKVAGIAVDWQTGQYTITFTCNEPDVVKQNYDGIKDLEKLDIKVVKHRKKRSLDANAYAWVLMGKLAHILGTSKDEVYKEMLRRYGVLYEDEDGHITITAKNTVDMGKIDGHWMKIKDNGKYIGYAMIKGSSQYDTTEMSRFIDGVISECKEQNIETITPEELDHMKAVWKP